MSRAVSHRASNGSAASLPLPFLLRRLHSLTGAVPLGFWILQQIAANAAAFAGPVAFDARLDPAARGAFSVFFDIAFIALPLAFHALFGLVLLYQGKSKVLRYRHAANVRYVLQRATAVFGLAFLAYHLYLMVLAPFASDSPLTAEFASTLLSHPLRLAFYLAGSTAVLFHFCNGMWSFLIAWGVTVSQRSRDATLVLCLALFTTLALVNAATILKIASFTLGDVGGGD